MDDRAAIDTTTLKGKAMPAVLILIALIFGWFGVRWQIGHMLAVLVRPDANGAYALAQLASNWASTDPAAWALRAGTVDDPAADERMDPLPIYQQAARLGPNDLNWRTALAKALEQQGSASDAEREFRKAVELAPNYSEPHWELGNFLLRQNREADAIAELRFAANGDLSYREQFFSLLWDRSAKDESKLAAAASTDPELKSYLAFFYASRGQATASQHAWEALAADDRQTYSATGKGIAQALLTQRHYSQSLAIARSLGNTSEAGVITNGSFEQALESTDEPNFGWRMGKPEAKIEVGSDNRVGHDGSRSLRLTFRGFNKPTFLDPLQTVVVEPGKRYRLRLWVRTENLRSGGNPVITVQNGVDDSVIVQSSQSPQGTNDWQEVSVEFAIPQNCDGIIISVGRAFCGDDCPITGIVWFDDLRLEKL